MADEYVTDPELLKQLNGSEEYVSDPALLAQLNSQQNDSTQRQPRLPLMGVDLALPAAELGLTALSGGFASTIGGLAGLAHGVTSAIRGKGLDQSTLDAAATQQAIEDYGTYTPKSEGSKALMQSIAPTAEYITQKVDDGVFAVSGGNPALATILKTGAVGALDIFGGRAARSAAGAVKKFNRVRDDVSADISGAGYDLSSDKGLTNSTLSKIEGMAPDRRQGADFDILLEDLRSKQKAGKAAEKKAWDNFRDVADGIEVETKPFADLAGELRTRLLADGTPLKDTAKLNDVLDDMENLGSRSMLTGKPVTRATAQLLEIDVLRKKISRNIEDLSDARGKALPGNGTQVRGLVRAKKVLDGALARMFDNAAMEVGENISKKTRAGTTLSGGTDVVPAGAGAGAAAPTRASAAAGGAQTGNPALQMRIEAIRDAWKGARGASAAYHKQFDANKTVRKMLLEDITPEQAYRYVVGASSMGASKQAAETIKALKRILGDDSRSITLIRQAAVRDVLAPGLADKPNFLAVAKNIDTLLDKNYTLVQELGIPEKELRRLARAARVSQSAYDSNPARFDDRFITSAIASVAFGHGIARKGAIVRGAKTLLQQLFGVGKLGRSEIRDLLAETQLSHTPMASFDTSDVAAWLAKSGAPAYGEQFDNAIDEDEE